MVALMGLSSTEWVRHTALNAATIHTMSNSGNQREAVFLQTIIEIPISPILIHAFISCDTGSQALLIED
jgi:site-specific recombinase